MEASPTYEPLGQHPSATRLLNAQPDSVLCRLAARGNVGAYDALYQRYRQPVFAFIFHLLGRADGTEDAEDIAQDAFTRAFAGIREKRVDGSFKAWLYTIARNRTYDLIRTRRQKVVSLDAEMAEPPAAPAIEQPAERAEQRAEFVWLMAAVAELPERQREALLLREMGGFSHEKIAEELGTTVSATKKLISRGRDGIGDAAATVGYGRVSRRTLGRDLAMAAPILPLSMSLASIGVGAGTVAAGGAAAGGAAAGSAAAGGGMILGGKAAATALTVIAVGGGAVAVKHETAPPTPKPVVQRQDVALGGPNAGQQNSKAPRGVAGRPQQQRGNSGPGDQSRPLSGRSDGSGGRFGSGDGADHSGPGRRGGGQGPGLEGERGAGDDRAARAESPDNSGPGSGGSGERGGDAPELGGGDQSGSGGGSNSGPGSGSGSGSGSDDSSGEGPGGD